MLRKSHLAVFIALLSVALVVVAGCGDDGGSVNVDGNNGNAIDGNGGNPDGAGLAQALVFTSPG